MRTDSEPPDDFALPPLARELEPPPALEERVVAALRRRGLLDRGRAVARRFALAASALLVFGAGLLAGRALEPAGAPSAGEERGRTYLLLLYEPRPLDRGEGDLVAEYSAWAGQLARAGRLVAAEKLGRESWRYRAGAGGPSAGERAEVPAGAPGEPTGFFLVRAGDLAEAERIARDCPHLRHGGEVALRPVDPT